MPETLYRMLGAKQMQMRVIDLRSGKEWKPIGATGHIMKGRNGRPERIDEAGYRYTERDEQYFWGELYSNEIKGRITVVFNPTLPSSGYERALKKNAPYPAVREFKLYVIVQFELPWLARVRYGKRVSKVLSIANKLEDPIRVRTTLSKEWGLEPGLEYKLQDDEIPMWPWDWNEMDFHPRNPVTGGVAIPAAYVLQKGDRLRMIRTWRNQNGVWVRRDA